MWPLTIEGAEVFGLLLVRSLSFFTAGPVFSTRGIPVRLKVLLGAAIAVALFPSVPRGPAPASDLLGFTLAVAGETFIGIVLAFGASLPFVAIRMAGGLLGVQMGFGIVNVMDPREGGSRVPILSKLYGLLAVLLFLLMNGHHLLLRALSLSLKTIPVGGVGFHPGLAEHLLGMAGSAFVMALAIGGPLIAVLFLTDAAMGFIARTVPQMNVFIVGFPVKIGLGLLGVAVTLPYFFRSIERLLPRIERDLVTLLNGM